MEPVPVQVLCFERASSNQVAKGGVGNRGFQLVDLSLALGNPTRSSWEPICWFRLTEVRDPGTCPIRRDSAETPKSQLKSGGLPGRSSGLTNSPDRITHSFWREPHREPVPQVRIPPPKYSEASQSIGSPSAFPFRHLALRSFRESFLRLR